MLVILLFVIICCYNLKVYRGDKDKYLALGKTIAIRGMLALAILLCHTIPKFNIYYKNRLLTSIMDNFISIGYLSVCIFFLLSAYGLMQGIQNKKDYLNGFIYKRLPKVIIPFVLINIIYILTRMILGERFSLLEIISSFFSVSIMPNAWYVIVIIIFYLAFYFIFKNNQYDRGKKILIIFTLLYIITVILFDFRNWWYVSNLSFIVGIVLSAYFNKINAFVNKHYIKIFIINFILFFITYKLSFIINFIFNKHCLEEVAMLLSSLFFSIIFILIIMKIEFNNKIINFYGEISFELYLIHGLFIKVLMKYNITNYIVFVVLVLIFSTFGAIVIHSINLKLIKLFYKKTTKYLSRDK